MTRAEAIAAIGVGLAVVDELVASGLDLIGVGEMGHRQHHRRLGHRRGHDRCHAGRGHGARYRYRRRRARPKGRGESRRPSPGTSPIRASDAVLGAVGGLETARSSASSCGAAAARVPVVLDGSSPAPPPCLRPRSRCIAGRLIAAHQSIEPGHAILLDRLGLRLLLDLDLRLGEGTGAALAFQSIDAAVRVRDDGHLCLGRRRCGAAGPGARTPARAMTETSSSGMRPPPGRAAGIAGGVTPHCRPPVAPRPGRWRPRSCPRSHETCRS